MANKHHINEAIENINLAIEELKLPANPNFETPAISNKFMCEHDRSIQADKYIKSVTNAWSKKLIPNIKSLEKPTKPQETKATSPSQIEIEQRDTIKHLQKQISSMMKTMENLSFWSIHLNK